MKKTVLAVLIFFLVYILDSRLGLLDPVEERVFFLKTAVYELKHTLMKLPGCLTMGDVFERSPQKEGTVLGSWGEEIVVKGAGDVGDVVVGVDGNFVGFVEVVLGDTLLVKTPLSRNLTMRVEVLRKGGIGVEGILRGGYPPLLEIPEKMDVVGWKVYVSRSEDLGFVLREAGMGYVGTVVGVEGGMFVVEPAEVPGRVMVIGR